MKKPNLFRRMASYFKECYLELKKVIWPTWESVKSNSVVVIVSVLCSALVLGIFDIVLVRIINIIV